MRVATADRARTRVRQVTGRHSTQAGHLTAVGTDSQGIASRKPTINMARPYLARALGALRGAGRAPSSSS